MIEDTSRNGPTGGPADRPSRSTEDEVRELARSMSIAVLKRLEQIALHGIETAAVQAIELILDRAFGKPPQIVTTCPGVVVELPAKEKTEPLFRNDKLEEEHWDLVRARERCPRCGPLLEMQARERAKKGRRNFLADVDGELRNGGF